MIAKQTPIRHSAFGTLVGAALALGVSCSYLVPEKKERKCGPACAALLLSQAKSGAASAAGSSGMTLAIPAGVAQ